MNKNLKEILEDNNVIMIMEFGSHLYGTNTPDSDTDYKGIFLPTKKQILLQNIPKSISFNSKNTKQSGIKNTKHDVDIELYSLNYFIELCLKGETVGIDMLHCPDNKLVYSKCLIWENIRLNRSKFYTNNLKGFVGYCRKQAAKYGIKGSRIADARRVYHFLYRYSVGNLKMKNVWDALPKGEHIHFIYAGKNNDEEFYQVCGKKMQKTATISHCLEILENFIGSYGNRALRAEKNEGIDWKAVSHAMRYGLQIKELFETKDIKFPLKDAKYLTEIKQGKLNYFEQVAPKLECLMDEIEELSKTVYLPKKPNKRFWDEYIVNLYSHVVIS